MAETPGTSPDSVSEPRQRVDAQAALPGFSRYEAIRAAATVAQALGETLHRYQTREIKGAMLAAACMSTTIADGLVAVVHVIDSNGQSHAATIARSMVEALCDLEMLCRDEDSLKHLQYAAARGTANTRRAWLRRVSPNVDPVRFALVTAELEESERQIYELKANGAIKLTMADKFDRAPKAAQFEAFYNDFCTSTHNDLSALATRHLRDDDHLRIGDTLSDELAVHILSICSLVAFRVFEYLPRLMEASAEEIAPHWHRIAPTMDRLGRS